MKFRFLNIIMFFFILGCKNNDEPDIIKDWKGTETIIGGITGDKYNYPIEIGFSKKNKAWRKNLNNQKKSIKIFKYYVKSDSIFFNKGLKNEQKGKIEIVTDTKLILTTENINGQKIIYTLEKIK